MMKSAWLIGSVVTASILFLTGCGTGGNATNYNAANNNTAKNNTVNNSTSTNSAANNSGPQGPTARWKAMPPMSIQTNKQYLALVHTNYGDFTIQLFANKSPKTVNSFVFLAEHKFYKDDKFFRIVQNFMIQTGDPNNNGTGGPGYTIPDELPPEVPYTAGIVAMANTGAPNSGGSQFFICTVNDTQQLPPNYTELGKVVSGMNVIQKIAAIPVVANPVMGGEMSKPTKDAYIESITITVQ